MSRVLFADVHVTVTFDVHGGLVCYRRTQAPYASLDVVRDLHEQLQVVLHTLSQGPLKLLLDTRDAPPRNDPGFETEISKAMQAFIVRFAVRAVLVKSAVGKLQVQRLWRA